MRKAIFGFLVWILIFPVNSIGQNNKGFEIELVAPLGNVDDQYRIYGDSLFKLNRPFELYDYLHSEQIEIPNQKNFVKVIPKSILDSLSVLETILRIKGKEELSCDVLDGYALRIIHDSLLFNCGNCLLCAKKEDSARIAKIHRLAYLVIK
jgi:hypothetical protein